MLRRGNYELAHMCQSLGYDGTEQEILANPGKRVMAYRLSRDQKAMRVSHNYEYLIYSPRSSALSWTAFETPEAFAVWLTAYGIVCNPEVPEPGAMFELILPLDMSKAQPLIDDGRLESPPESGYLPMYPGDKLRLAMQPTRYEITTAQARAEDPNDNLRYGRAERILHALGYRPDGEPSKDETVWRKP